MLSTPFDVSRPQPSWASCYPAPKALEQASTEAALRYLNGALVPTRAAPTPITRSTTEVIDIMVVDEFQKSYQDAIINSPTAHGEETSWLADEYSEDPSVAVENITFGGFPGFASWLTDLAASGDVPRVMNLSVGMDPGSILYSKSSALKKSYISLYGPETIWTTTVQGSFKLALQNLIAESQAAYDAGYGAIGPQLKEALAKIVAAGTTVTIAAGNAGEVKTLYDQYGIALPSDFFDGTYAADQAPGVIVVGASTGNSSYDTAAVFTAPMNGVDIATDGTQLTINTYGEVGDGTSYSAPIVAGLVGDMIAADPTLTPAEIEATLKASARRVAGKELLVGAGIIDREKALEMVRSGESHNLPPGDHSSQASPPLDEPKVPYTEPPPSTSIAGDPKVIAALKAAGMSDADVAAYASTVVGFEVDPANKRPGWPVGGPSFLDILKQKLAANVPAGDAILWARFSGLVKDSELSNSTFMRGLALAGTEGYGATALDSIQYARAYQAQELFSLSSIREALELDSTDLYMLLLIDQQAVKRLLDSGRTLKQIAERPPT